MQLQSMMSRHGYEELRYDIALPEMYNGCGSVYPILYCSVKFVKSRKMMNLIKYNTV